MRLEIASTKAIKYACMNFHYAKAVPVNAFGFSVFNEKSEWCGVIIYSLGANKNLPTFFKLKQGEVCELVRVALNGKHGSTSKAMAISIKLLKSKLPLVKLLVSYSDRNHGHYGTIYQATNWIYSGDSTNNRTPIIDGKRIHAKSIHSKYGTNNTKELQKKGVNIKYEKDLPKHRYIYPLHKKLIPMCKAMAKPYPKNAAVAHKGERRDSNPEGAFDSTSPLNLQGKNRDE